MWNYRLFVPTISAWETWFPEIAEGDFSRAYRFWLTRQNFVDDFGRSFAKVVQSFFREVISNATTNVVYKTILPFAAQQGYEEIVQFLIEKQSLSLDMQLKNSALFLAVKNNQLAIAKRLIAAGTDVNMHFLYNNELIQLPTLAARKGYTVMQMWLRAEIWKQHIEQQAGPWRTMQIQAAFDAAIEADHKPLFVQLLKLGYQPNVESKVFGLQIKTLLNSKLSCDTSYATIRDYLIDFEQYGPVIPALIEGAERASAEDIAEQFVPVPNAKI